MDIKLPTVKSEPSRVNPKSLIIFGKEKSGKSTLLSALDDCLIIDLEQGTDFLTSLKYDVIKEAEKEETLPINILRRLIRTIKKANKEKEGYVYKYIAIDTVSALEDIVLPLANKLYKDTPQGKRWDGDDVTQLANGAGYRFTRAALLDTIAQIQELCDTLIITGHVKDKLIESKGSEINERGLALTGKSASILCAKVDAIGYVYRKDNKTVINFKPSESLIVGGRSKHLIEQEIVAAESDDDNNMTYYWDRILK